MTFDRKAVTHRIYLDGQLQDSLQLISIRHSAGAKRLDTAKILVDPSSSVMHAADFQMSSAQNVEVRVQALDPNISGAREVHWGKISSISPMLNPRDDRRILVSRIEPFHFGRPVNGISQFNPFTGVPIVVDRDLTFNPVVDGLVVGNMHSNITDVRIGANLFLDFEAVRTFPAVRLQRGTAIAWTLARAVNYLIRVLNGRDGPGLITAPGLVELTRTFDPRDQLRNLTIRKGTFLPAALDALLNPLGYFWRIEFRQSSRAIKFFRRGIGGPLKTVQHQRIDAVFDQKKTNVERLGVTFDSSRVRNEVSGKGSPEHYELSMILHRAWPESDDDKDSTDTRTDQDAADFQKIRNVYRKWVMNEGGDYIGTRPEIRTPFNTIVFTFLRDVKLLDRFQPRPRRLLPTITLDEENISPIGQVQGVTVEYSNPAFDALDTSPTAKPEFLLLDPGGCQLLTHEAGILFTGRTVPDQVISQQEKARIRVTATLEADVNVTGFAPRLAGSVLTDPASLVLDLSTAYHFRQRLTLSIYALTKGEGSSRDDRIPLQLFCESMRDTWDQADVRGRVVLEGLDHDFEVGDRVRGVAGRDISFQSRPGNPAFPNIMAIDHDKPNQRMILHLQRISETFRR
ncbi:MAG: hypothetical protein O7D91_21425 [Planctomycetota bacterium]|nr:hypothetical protein [Planctomycetota bacterium]